MRKAAGSFTAMFDIFSLSLADSTGRPCIRVIMKMYVAAGRVPVGPANQGTIQNIFEHCEKSVLDMALFKKSFAKSPQLYSARRQSPGARSVLREYCPTSRGGRVSGSSCRSEPSTTIKTTTTLNVRRD